MIRLSVPGTLLYRDAVLRVVSSGCRLVLSARIEQEARQTPGNEDFDSKVVSAVGEAFNNIAIHGYSGTTPGNVDIEIEPSGDGITIRMLDTGKGFDPVAEPAPDLEKLPESHMGLFIVRSFMDSVSYRRGTPPDFPNVLVLVKKYPQPISP